MMPYDLHTNTVDCRECNGRCATESRGVSMSLPRQPIVIYHADCADGLTAAWVLKNSGTYRDSLFLAANYGDVPPNVTNAKVLIVDFSYPKDVLLEMTKAAHDIVLLDHHKTAQADLEELRHSAPMNLRIWFNMAKSGAGLAWEWIHPGAQRPWLVDYVEDRDLWRWALPHSKEINAWIGTQPRTFEAWDRLDACDVLTVRERGESVLAFQEHFAREMKPRARMIGFEGYLVPVVNMAPILASETLNELNVGELFAIGWFQRPDGKFQFSLRSRGDFDVSALAKKYGGGGHKNAAGFALDEFPAWLR